MTMEARCWANGPEHAVVICRIRNVCQVLRSPFRYATKCRRRDRAGGEQRARTRAKGSEDTQSKPNGKGDTERWMRKLHGLCTLNRGELVRVSRNRHLRYNRKSIKLRLIVKSVCWSNFSAAARRVGQARSTVQPSGIARILASRPPDSSALMRDPAAAVAAVAELLRTRRVDWNDWEETFLIAATPGGRYDPHPPALRCGS